MSEEDVLVTNSESSEYGPIIGSESSDEMGLFTLLHLIYSNQGSVPIFHVGQVDSDRGEVHSYIHEIVEDPESGLVQIWPGTSSQLHSAFISALNMDLVELKPVEFSNLNTEDTTSKTLEAGEKAVALQLSEKGFDIAHERELRKQQQSSNLLVVALTIVLAASAALSFGWNVYINAGIQDVVSPAIVAVILLGIFVVSLFFVRRFIRQAFSL